MLLNLDLWEIAQQILYLHHNLGLSAPCDDTSDLYDLLKETVSENQIKNLYDIVIRPDWGYPIKEGDLYADEDFNVFRVNAVCFEKRVLDIVPIGSNLYRMNDSFEEGLNFIFMNLKLITEEDYFRLLDVIYEVGESKFFRIDNVKRLDFPESNEQNLTNK